ncbi:bifunctional DNA-formamidopyrimidine glycosylase/DNA-(apurinic or apyrimidinic site) lyase [Desulfovibrio legallii]|uniref:Formamidopyrimidine-DNA glycosylase n=1 Tax=Desulfovibrio legallii TaxID=571438 RepID=A0A1G7N317_9BACT|nr:bifunctional DNA-formamidopyrimidine glycosylase/DNA-(apurinic or apyrimidinic site) lyase [Desulfovibrio legallii]SDF67749.1 DNA-(apurinic or apyrimidinic site) lyase [Desulfovibrio legallii]
MPELPEVETVARTLRPQVLGCRLGAARALRASSLHPLSLPLERLDGVRVAAVGRRGKLLLLDLDPGAAVDAALRAATGLRLAIHLRMTGRVRTVDAACAPGPYTRCVFAFRTPAGEARQLFFDDVRAFGLVLAATPDILARWSFWRDLGPEPLELGAADFAALLRSRRSALKAVLLDQKTIAGVGNIYADESLFAAGLDPRRKADSLTPAQSARLLACLKDVLLRSIAQCGSSIRDYRDANGDVGAFQNCFAVYGRGGEACTRCGRPLQKLRVAGRATVCCPHCQR